MIGLAGSHLTSVLCCSVPVVVFCIVPISCRLLLVCTWFHPNVPYALVSLEVSRSLGHSQLVDDLLISPLLSIGKSIFEGVAEKPKEFWRDDLFMDELDNVLVHLRVQNGLLIWVTPGERC